MKTSVLMSVYNGEEYLLSQLISLLNQTVRADEVIIIDDCSKDNSINIIREFIVEHDLQDTWLVYQNSTNKGWKRNFMEGIEKTSGEIIFFSDQDDVWLKEKIETYCEVFRDDSVNVVISPYIEWYGNEKVSLPKMSPSNRRVRLQGNYKNFNITGSGCTLAFRKTYYEKIEAYYVDGWAHDDFFRKLPQIDGSLAVIKTPSILRRFHGNNASKKKRTYESTCVDLEVGVKCVDMIKKYISDTNNIVAKKENDVFLDRIKRGCISRLNYFRTGKIKYLFKTVFKNNEQYSRARQILGDYLLVTNGRRS